MTDILEQIDDVITDWRGSADAMCWTAEPPTDVVPWHPLTEEQLAERRQQIRVVFQRLAEQLRDGLAQLAPAFEQFGKALQSAYRAMRPVVEAHREYRRHLHASYRQRSLARRRRNR